MIKCSALVEFAPGIPRKERVVAIPSIKSPTVWKYGLQLHDAEKAGRHFDLRIGDDKGNAHSWALRKLPEPGQKVLAVQQPTHTVDYMPFSGEIPSGYGKGMVHSVRFEPTEVVKAGPNRLTFHLHKGHRSEELTLTRMANKAWLLINHTTTRKSKPQIPSSKPKYREIPFTKVPGRINKDNETMTVKIDGGHNTFLFESGKPLRIFSYRPTERDTGVIEHTHRVPGALQTVVPKALNGTILRGELYARDKSGKHPLPSQIVGGMLNANVWLSRARQKEHGRLRAAIFDVVKWKGKNVENAPYAQKLEMLKEVKKLIPWLELPASADTSKTKQELLRKVMSNEHPQTREGVVFWDKTKGTPPIKAKIVQEYDVIIKRLQPGAGELEGKGIGAVHYGVTKDPKEIKGRVGTGFTRAMRQHMHQNPRTYIGKTMKVMSQGKFPSGALRSPRFVQMHLDTLEGGEKIAAVIQKIAAKRRLTYLARYIDDVVRLARRHRRTREREKRADLTASGPSGFAEHMHSKLPTSALDTQGRLRTNDDPVPQVPRKTAPIQKPDKRSLRSRRSPAVRLYTSGDRNAGDYHGAEPLGVDRGFHANHENFTVG